MQLECDLFMKMFDVDSDPVDLKIDLIEWINERALKDPCFDFLGPVLGPKVTSLAPLTCESARKRDELKAVGAEVGRACSAIDNSFFQMMKMQEQIRNESGNDATFQARKASLEKWVDEKKLVAQKPFVKVEDELREVCEKLEEGVESLISAVETLKVEATKPSTVEESMMGELEILMAGISVAQVDQGENEKDEKDMVGDNGNDKILSLPTLVLGGEGSQRTDDMGTPSQDHVHMPVGENNEEKPHEPPRDEKLCESADGKKPAEKPRESPDDGKPSELADGEPPKEPTFAGDNGKPMDVHEKQPASAAGLKQEPDHEKQHETNGGNGTASVVEPEPEGLMRTLTPEETALAHISKLEDGAMKSALLSLVEAQVSKAGK